MPKKSGPNGEYNDYPLSDIEKSFKKHRLHGAICFQKFTCSGCGNRLTIEEPFKIYTQGTCDNCNAVTNIEEQGCNFIMVHPSDPKHFMETWEKMHHGS